MANFIMNFLHGIEQTAMLPIQFSEDYSNEFANLGNKLDGAKDQTIQQNMGGDQLSNFLLKQSGATGTNKQLASDVLQAGAMSAGGGLAETGAKAVAPIAEQTGTGFAGKVVGGAVKGATAGATAGAPFGAAQAVGTAQKPSDVTMGFLQGAEGGAVMGGALGAGGAAIANRMPLASEAGGANQPPSSAKTLFTPKQLDQLAKATNEKQITNILTTKLGPVVSKEITPAVATSHDPNIVANVIDNQLSNKLRTTTPEPTGVQPQSPAPPETTPPPQENVNAPQTGEGSAEGKNVGNEANNGYRVITHSDGSKDYIPAENTAKPVTPNEPLIDKNNLQTGQNVEVVKGGGSIIKGQILKAEKQTTSVGGGAAANAGTRETVWLTIKEANGNVDNVAVPLDESGNEINGKVVVRNLDFKPEGAVGNNVNNEAFMNGPNENKPTSLSKLGAVTGMHDILNQGGTVDEALNHYMENTGTNIGQAKQALNDLLDKSGPEGSLEKGNINAKLNPEFGKIKLPPATTNEQAINQSRMVRNAVTRAGNNALAEVDKLSPADMKLMDELRTTNPDELAKQAEDPGQFKAAADAVKKYNDTTQALGAGELGQDVPYRQNYGAPLLFQNDQEAIQAAKAKLPTTPGYGKGRFFHNYDEAQTFGLQRKNENIMGDLYEDIQRRSNSLAQLTLAKGLEDVHPGMVKTGDIGVDESGQPYSQLQVPGGQRISLPKPIADEINKRAPAPTATGMLGKYDTVNSEWKNLKLGAGGFHSLNVMGSFVADQLSTGKAFTDPGAIADVFKTTFSKNAMDGEMERMGQEGTLLNADASGLTFGKEETAADIGSGGKVSNLPILKQMHDAIFNRQIPYMKLRSFEQRTEGLDRHNPEDLQKMQDVAKEINQVYGGLNREVQGLTPRQFAIAARGFLATDYNEGQIRTLVDAFTQGGQAGKMARQIVFGKALLFGGLATAGGAVGGEFKNMTPEQVATDILQKVVNPEFKFGSYKVGLPTTQVAELGKPLETTITGAKAGHPGWGVQDFLSARLAAIPSAVEQGVSNRNFYGQTLYGTDTHGRPIPALDSLKNIAIMATPIPATNAVQTASGNESIGAAIANTIGARVTPAVNEQSLPVAAQTYMQQAEQAGVPKDRIDAMGQFFETLKSTSNARYKANTQAVADMIKYQQTGDQKYRQDALNTIGKYNTSLIKALQPWLAQNKQYMDRVLYDQLTNGNYSDPYVSPGYGMLKLSSLATDMKNVKANPQKYGFMVGKNGAIIPA